MIDLKYFLLCCIIYFCIYLPFVFADSFSDIVNAPNFKEINLLENEKLITDLYDGGNAAGDLP